MRPNTGFYAREINEIVQNTEKWENVYTQAMRKYVRL